MQISDLELFGGFPSIFGRYSKIPMNLEEDVDFKVCLQTEDGKADRESDTKGAKKVPARGSRGKDIRDSNENVPLREAMNTSDDSMDREDSKERDK